MPVFFKPVFDFFPFFCPFPSQTVEEPFFLPQNPRFFPKTSPRYFVRNGGIKERMLAARLEERNKGKGK